MIDWAAWDRRTGAIVGWMQSHPLLTLGVMILLTAFGIPAIAPFLH